ncbi:MAG TPA: helix-turn-helix transcriptional regulator [Anaerolineaceae bacterium]|jgi:DNA-binding CsgD family transcriptional regulator|nr:helix-turn-helix transcriptional regulator [Anaerolineaceae bacterium]HPS33559.1 helix-turn-helix transcriptional regulator [Anaerolineaceae bacterium]
MAAEHRLTQVYVFGSRDTVQILHVAPAPGDVLFAVRHGNWEPYIGAQDDHTLRWQAHQAGKIVIILPEEELPAPFSVRLTPQENRVLQLLAGGYTPAQICQMMHITERSVRRYMNHLRDKFRARTLLHMLAKAVAMGMVRLNPESLED